MRSIVSRIIWPAGVAVAAVVLFSGCYKIPPSASTTIHEPAGAAPGQAYMGEWERGIGPRTLGPAVNGEWERGIYNQEIMREPAGAQPAQPKQIAPEQPAIREQQQQPKETVTPQAQQPRMSDTWGTREEDVFPEEQ